ncbi:MAG: cytochrome c3 family protein, partial [Longimicrobiales bacterium]
MQEELDCVICHGEALTDERPGMPAPDTCLLCHDSLDREQPPERQVASLFEGEEFLAARYGALPDEVIFSHQNHTGYQKCGDCHIGIEANKKLSRLEAVDMAACVDCHESTSAPGECSAC